MAKFIKLRDQDGSLEEYVDSDQIARIEPSVFSVYEPVTKTDKSWFGKDQTYKVMEFKEEQVGSCIYMKGCKDHTYVKESPFEVIQLIKGVSNE